MRILFITRKFPPSIGGMETYSACLIRELSAEVEVADIFKPTVPMHGRPSLLELARLYASAAWHLLKHARGYDVVLLGDYALSSLALFAKAATAWRITTAVSLHGNDLYFMRKQSLVARTYTLVMTLVARSAIVDVAIANSHAIAREAALRRLTRVEVVPLGTDSPQGPLDVHRKPGQLLFAGRLIRYKGLSWFMREVWSRLPVGVSLVVAGPIWDPEEAESIHNVDRVTYLGALPPETIPRLRAESVACLMPNLLPMGEEQDEGFGIAALEGPAVGTPTLASATGGLLDAVAEGVTGFILPPLDAEAWAGRIREILDWSEADRERFAADAKQHVAAHFNWTLVAKRTVAVLREVSSARAAIAKARHG
jgi:phosphatidylinositol alpha-1,6-mannosyltransferase